jgi:hypothetical protein
MHHGPMPGCAPVPYCRTSVYDMQVQVPADQRLDRRQSIRRSAYWDRLACFIALGIAGIGPQRRVAALILRIRSVRADSRRKNAPGYSSARRI